ncbi:MAG: arginine--tRNA ligase [Peptococcaceae bacterium]|jgi:arginyl-tRNA synthetase|nr:arginine--tRNA ligase [Peptococcaceae bacterium]
MNPVREIKVLIQQEALAAWERAAAAGQLSTISPLAFTIEAPRDKNHGDFAVNIAMLMAKEEKKAPRQIAQILSESFAQDLPWLARLEIAGPGFINFYLTAGYFHPTLPAILAADESYGASDFGGGRKVQIEFVSANPTGLLHMGNARGAALGDSLANIMAAAGFKVSREYYLNDAGNQIENFGKSLEARYLELLGQKVEFPEDGYQGEDIIETAKGILAAEGDRFLQMDSVLRREFMIQAGLKEKLERIRRSLEGFGVRYDVWFSEQSLHDGGEIRATVNLLREKGLLYEKEGALWLETTAFGDEKDEVLVRANGVPTYFAGDIAYHRNKFERGFAVVIDIWGADHHGHVARMKGAMAAIGRDPAALEVILMQLVRLLRGKETVRMSKRGGQYVTLDELVEEVGRDAARFFFIMRGADSQMDFDLDLAKSQSADNPVYYVQYAHARIHSLLKMAAVEENGGGGGVAGSDGGVGAGGGAVAAGSGVGGGAVAAGSGGGVGAGAGGKGAGVSPWAGADVQLLSHPAERALIRKLADLPEEIALAAREREPHRLPRYAMDLAALFHSFYAECRCLVEDRELRRARLLLADATRIGLRNVLRLIGVSAPERM